MTQSVEEEQISKLSRLVSLLAPAYSILLYNHEEELITLGQWANKIARDQQLPPRSTFGLDLCLAEIVTNCIEHAFTDKDQHPIYVRAEFHPRILRLVTIDGGIAFNPLERSNDHSPTTLDDAPIGGLGICLLRQYTSMIRYQRVENHNLLELHLPLHRSRENQRSSLRPYQPMRDSGRADNLRHKDPVHSVRFF